MAGDARRTRSRAKGGADAAPKPGAPHRINLALQGGGAHGAFTWGVLDRLLDEEDIEIEGVTATSAGAMNGAMLTTGLKIGGRAEAKARLERFWTNVRDQFPLNNTPWALWAKAFSPLDEVYAAAMSPAMMNPAMVMADFVTRVVSPYQFNPIDINPLRDLLEELIDFGAVCAEDDPRLYVCATDVKSGRARIFQGESISVEALLASACLPQIYQAVEIDGRAYWDGGYTGNPPLWPLFYECDSRDIMLVQINPIERDEAPRDARAIRERVNEISFNSTLLNELRAINTIDKLLERGHLESTSYRKILVHPIEDQATMQRYTASTKLSPDAAMLADLRDAGSAAMEAWLKAHKSKLGRESSVDLRDRYL